MEPFITAMATGAPWILGAAILYALANQRATFTIENHLLIIGSSGYIGFITLSLTASILQHFNKPVFSVWLLGISSAIIVACLSWLLYHRVKRPPPPTSSLTTTDKNELTKSQKALITSAFFWIGLSICFVGWETYYRPAVAWDTTLFWAHHGNEFLRSQLDTLTFDSMSPAKHPATLKYIGAWSAFNSNYHNGQWLYLPWAVLYACNILAIIGITMTLSKDWVVSILTGALMAGSPLIESQASLAGYADIWVSSAILLALIWSTTESSTLGFSRQTYILISMCMIASIMLLKGNTIAYALIIGVAISLTWALIKLHWIIFLGCLLGLSTFMALTFTYGVDFGIPGGRVAFLPEEGTIMLGQRTSQITSNSWVEIGRNFYYAWVIRSSFNITSGALLVLIFLFVLSKKHRCDFSYTAGIFTSIGLILFFALGQHISSQHLFNAAAPNQDLSLSRFSQIIFPLTIFLVAKAISIHLKAKQNASTPRKLPKASDRSP